MPSLQRAGRPRYVVDASQLARAATSPLPRRYVASRPHSKAGSAGNRESGIGNGSMAGWFNEAMNPMVHYEDGPMAR